MFQAIESRQNSGPSNFSLWCIGVFGFVNPLSLWPVLHLICCLFSIFIWRLLQLSRCTTVCWNLVRRSTGILRIWFCIVEICFLLILWSFGLEILRLVHFFSQFLTSNFCHCCATFLRNELWLISRHCTLCIQSFIDIWRKRFFTVSMPRLCSNKKFFRGMIPVSW